MTDYLTIDGVAVLMGRNRKAIEKMVERRLLPFRKHGKRVIFQRLELERFLDNLPGVTLAEAEQSLTERCGKIKQ